MKIELRNITLDDLPFVKRAESAPENRQFVDQWNLSEHRGSLTNPDIRHMIIEELAAVKPVGYIILAGLTNKNRSLEFKRLVVTEKNRGYGRNALELIKKIAFEELKFHRLWLDVREHNLKAKKLYESCGFKEEGLLRESVFLEGAYHSVSLFAMLESDYLSDALS